MIFRSLTFSILLVALTWPTVSLAADDKQPWALLTGYGFSHTKLGNSKQWVETVDLVGRYRFRHPEPFGRSWYEGYYEVLLELPVHFVVDPAANAMVGVNVLANYQLRQAGPLKPYFFGGGGPVYCGSKLEGMGRHLNGNYQFGMGLHLGHWYGHTIQAEYRYHHISNGNRADPNTPVNSSKFLVGVTF